MISRGRTLAPHVHLPLRQLALCLDCNECFELGRATCPACGSGTWTWLWRFLEQASSSRRPRRLDGSRSKANRPDDQPETVRQLIIVARNREDLYEHLKRAFAENETIRVLLDRRVVDRRARPRPYAAERRKGDRRSPFKIDGLLRAIGWAVVPQTAPGNHRGSTR
jgi:hypothetical protein